MKNGIKVKTKRIDRLGEFESRIEVDGDLDNRIMSYTTVLRHMNEDLFDNNIEDALDFIKEILNTDFEEEI